MKDYKKGKNNEKRYKITYADDFEHFLAWDESISVEIVHVKRPLELVLEFTTWRHTECT